MQRGVPEVVAEAGVAGWIAAECVGGAEELPRRRVVALPSSCAVALPVRFRDPHGLTRVHSAAICARHAAAFVTPAEQLATNRDATRTFANGDTRETLSASNWLWTRIASATTGSVHGIVDTTNARLTTAVDSPAYGGAVRRQSARASRAPHAQTPANRHR